MVEEVLARVEERLEVVGLSASAASKLAGLSEYAIRNMRRAAERNDRKGVSTRTITALAPVLKTTVGWLLTGEGDRDLPEQPMVPLVGYIGAGDAGHFYAQDQVGTDYGEVEADDAGGISAREIKGRSMGKMLEGWLVYTGPRQRGVPDKFYGHICEVGLPDGRVLIKKVTRSKLFENAVNLLSETEDPILDQVIDWSAVVTSMRPR